MTYNIALDEKIPEERRKDWEDFNTKYPPAKGMIMGRMVDDEYKHQPEQAEGRKWWQVIRDSRDDFKYPPVVPVKPPPVPKEESTSTPGFDIGYWLKRQGLLGQLYPWKYGSDEDPIYALMVPLTIAVDELRGNVTRYQLKKFCDDNEIFTGSWPVDPKSTKAADEWFHFKKQVLLNRKKEKEPMTPIRELANALVVSEDRINDDVLEGTDGCAEIIDGNYRFTVDVDTRRQLTSVKSQFSFMTLVSTTEHHKEEFFSGYWEMDKLPTLKQAEIIRKYVGFKKARIAEKPSVKIDHNNGVLEAETTE